MKLTFVYAGAPDTSSRCSPYTITRNLYNFFKAKDFEITYRDWCDTNPLPEIDPSSILIGHPCYPPNTPIRRLFDPAIKCKAKLLIFPFHHAIPEINWPFNDLVEKADAVLTITGPYWFDTMDKTVFAGWKKKMTRLDMAVDATQFPLVKTTFQAPGQRSYYYIGCDRPEKGVDQLCELFKRVPYQLHVYGNVDGANPIAKLPNVKLYGWADTNPDFASDLAAKADFFINISKSDAGATTITEANSHGFPVICNSQSGYWPDAKSGHICMGLNIADMDGCVHLLHHLQTVDESWLRHRSEMARETVLTNHTWEKFCNTVWGVVSRYV